MFCFATQSFTYSSKVTYGECDFTYHCIVLKHNNNNKTKKTLYLSVIRVHSYGIVKSLQCTKWSPKF